MKKMLIVLAALTVMGAGFATAEDQNATPKEPSQAYMHGYNMAANGEENMCKRDYSGGSASQKERNRYDCYQGYFQGQTDKNNASNQQSTGN
ncbi:MAG: hypothetical protein K2J14_06485 [Treponemataceae bacterium]|nr:hypothetical protein [Treponemataceae bacterium]